MYSLNKNLLYEIFDKLNFLKFIHNSQTQSQKRSLQTMLG